MANILRNVGRWFSIVLYLFIGYGTVCSQSATVKGVVVDDETNEPLSWVTVVVVPTRTGTIANLQGEFEASVPSLPCAVIFSRIGFYSDTVQIGTADVRVPLKKKVIQLPEIEIIAHDAAAVTIVKKVYAAIVQHKNDRRSSKGFYRQYAQSGKECSEIIEYFLDLQMNSYGITEKLISEGRYARRKRDAQDTSLFISLTNFSDMSTTLFRLAQDKEPFYMKLVPFATSSLTYGPIREDAETYFDFTIVNADTAGRERTITVQFTPHSGLDKPAYSGEIVVDADNDQVVQITMRIDNDERMNFFKNVMYKGFYLTRMAIERNVNYQRDSAGNYRLHSMETNIFLVERNRLDTIYAKQKAFRSFLFIYNEGNDNTVTADPATLGMSDIVAVTKAPYNPAFWKKHERIFDEVPVEEQMKRSVVKGGFYGNMFEGGELLP